MRCTFTDSRFRVMFLVVMTFVWSGIGSSQEGKKSNLDGGKSDKPLVGEGVFETTNVWAIHLALDGKEWEAMQPRGRGGFPGFGPPQPQQSNPDGRELHRNKFGQDLPWVAGALEVDGRTFPNVAIRFKGNGTIMDASRTVKKSVKVDLDRRGETATWRGIKTLNIHCGVTDPSKLRETLSYDLYRAAGVPAPKTAFAEVFLTVPGQFDRQLIGLYTLIEDVNKPFLRDRFGTDKGLLMKPEGTRELDYRGDDWERYRANLDLNRDAKDDEIRRLLNLSRLIHRADVEQFRNEIGSYLDLDAFLKFLAATAFIVNPDSAFALGHNYYLYLHPKTDRLHFIPWDVDRALANFPIFGSAEQQMDLSLHHPYGGTNKLVERLLAIPEVREKYDALLRELAAGVFSREALQKRLTVLEEASRPLLDRDKEAAAKRKESTAGGFGPPMMFAAPPPLATFIEKRSVSVAAQLAGKSKGHIPGGFGPGQFKPGDMLGQPVLDLLDADKDQKLSKEEWLAAARKLHDDSRTEGQDWVDEKSLATTLNGMFPQPPGGGGGPSGPADQRPNPGGSRPNNEGPGAGGPPRPPGGFNPEAFRPGNMLASAIIRKADADKNGQLTEEELLKTAEVLFSEQDSSKSGLLERAGVAELFNQLAPPPPPPAGGPFGGPAGGPPGVGGPPRPVPPGVPPRS